LSDTNAKLFGTDGIRARWGDEPLTPASVERIGLALAAVLAAHKTDSRAKAAPRVLIGRDTRASGPAILAALSAGLARGGWQPLDLGVVTTPGVAYCVRNLGAAAGVVISASHNPAEDNGIKVFGPDGFKLPDELEEAIEARFHAGFGATAAPPAKHPEALAATDATGHVAAYVEHLIANGRQHAQQPFAQRTLVVDCANGAASAIAPRVFRELGARVIEYACKPDGRNINDKCGALHPELLAEAVRAAGADVGVTFDGDADRVMLLDETGAVADGDIMLAMLAGDLKRRGELPKNAVAGTVMANFGLEVALKAIGVRLVRTPVGDRHVVAEMLRGGLVLGGEQSGHIIHLARGSTTGDGIFNAVSLLQVAFADVGRSGGKLSAPVRAFVRMPQILINVRVREKPPFETLSAVQQAAAAADKALAGRGRVVLRYSGTEALARVMVEGEPEPLIRAQADAIAAALRTSIGA
jgi:phosphoglucosamine mutase